MTPLSDVQNTFSYVVFLYFCSLYVIIQSTIQCYVYHNVHTPAKLSINWVTSLITSIIVSINDALGMLTLQRDAILDKLSDVFNYFHHKWCLRYTCINTSKRCDTLLSSNDIYNALPITVCSDNCFQTVSLLDEPHYCYVDHTLITADNLVYNTGTHVIEHNWYNFQAMD